ncbi:MAG: hypothetical protein HC880_04150 [Bacteroidia bacterium]|nr:hypothetical protein [Bacteroidia bacterium]
MVDLFRDKEVPEAFHHPDFIARLCQLSNPSGLIIFNKITETGIQKTSYGHWHKPLSARGAIPNRTILKGITG